MVKSTGNCLKTYNGILQAMSESIINQRMFAKMDGDFVVFLIGMRVDSFWKIHKWLPVILAMFRMLKELKNNPESTNKKSPTRAATQVGNER